MTRSAHINWSAMGIEDPGKRLTRHNNDRATQKELVPVLQMNVQAIQGLQRLPNNPMPRGKIAAIVAWMKAHHLAVNESELRKLAGTKKGYEENPVVNRSQISALLGFTVNEVIKLEADEKDPMPKRWRELTAWAFRNNHALRQDTDACLRRWGLLK